MITLGIIGVVAALTIPNLMQKTNDKEFEAGFEKSKTTLANGYKNIMARHEVYSDIMNAPFIAQCEDMENLECVRKYHEEEFKLVSDSLGNFDAPSGYTDTNGGGISFNWNSVPYKFRVTDGMIFGVYKNDEEHSLDVVIDTNGKKGPNRVGKDLHKVRLTQNLNIEDITSELGASDNEPIVEPKTYIYRHCYWNWIGRTTVCDETEFEADETKFISSDLTDMIDDMWAKNGTGAYYDHAQYIQNISSQTPVYHDDHTNSDYYCAVTSDNTPLIVDVYDGYSISVSTGGLLGNVAEVCGK